MSFYVKAIVTSHSEKKKNSQLEVQYSEDGGNEVLLSCQDASAKLSSAAYQKLQEFLDCTGHRSLGMLNNWGIFFLEIYHHTTHICWSSWNNLIILTVITRHVVWCFKFCCCHYCISYHRPNRKSAFHLPPLFSGTPLLESRLPRLKVNKLYKLKNVVSNMFSPSHFVPGMQSLNLWYVGIHSSPMEHMGLFKNQLSNYIHERGKDWLYSMPKKRIASAWS